jgi:hypothetical protein
MRCSALFTVFVTVFLGFLQLAFAEEPSVVYETVHSTSIRTAVVTSTGAAPLAEATAVQQPRVIKVFTISSDGQVLAALGPTANGTQSDAPTVTDTPTTNGTSPAPTKAPTQDADTDDKDSAAVTQMASLPLLVGVVAAIFGVVAL